jgi:hypothetical protein
LTYLEFRSEAELENILHVNNFQSTVKMPVGRVGWLRQSLQSFKTELETESMAQALTTSGFAKGSRRFLELFIINLLRISEEMSWR